MNLIYCFRHCLKMKRIITILRFFFWQIILKMNLNVKKIIIYNIYSQPIYHHHCVNVFVCTHTHTKNFFFWHSTNRTSRWMNSIFCKDYINLIFHISFSHNNVLMSEKTTMKKKKLWHNITHNIIQTNNWQSIQVAAYTVYRVCERILL